MGRFSASGKPTVPPWAATSARQEGEAQQMVMVLNWFDEPRQRTEK
ncbi:MAG: hypothetical protein IH965_15165 [Gemmatimonadetes bacterium]|nr:hypothetical protein [Gemmatimonadota bacterium]